MSNSEQRERDRLSGLPTHIIHQIFFFSDTRYAVQASVLSKRWRHIWRTLPFLRFFSEDTPLHSTYSLVNFVDKLLMLRDQSTDIESFTLFSYDSAVTPHVHSWILAAIRANLAHLQLALPVAQLQLHLPTSLFTSKSLVDLQLILGFRYPQLIMPSLIELPKLKSLALHYTTLVHVSYNTTSSSSEVVWSFPSLEILSIPDSLKDLVIDAPKLKEFNIAKWPGDDVLDRINSGVIKVLAPNLRFFKCDDCMMRNFSFKDLSYLDQACFSITTDDFRNAPIMKDSLVHCATRVVVQTCPHIKYLTLDGFAVEALFESPAVLENASMRFRNLEYLNLSVHLSGNCVIAIMHLLKLSPGIETINLVINYQNQGTSNRINMAKCRNLWISKECLLQQLRFVKIEGVVGSENELKLMKFVLKNALVLEKVSICCSEKALPRMLINFNKKVNEIPLASSPQISIPFLYDL